MKAAAAKAQETANLPFSQYTDDRVANLSPDTLASFDLARQAIGSTDSINNAAASALGNFGNYSGLATGTQALDAYGRPDLYSNLSYASPLVGNALPALNSSAAAYTQNLLDSSGANAKLPDVINNYLNPYVNDVVGQIAGLGERNLTENILPNINKTFVGGGAFGGSRNNEFMSRAVRDTNNDILGQQVSALNTGYNNAASQAQSDLSRLTGQAENLGGQYGGDLSRTISGTETLSNLLTNAGTSDADRRTSAAKYLEGLGSTDAANQLLYGQNLQSFGTSMYNQNLKDAALLEGIGQTQQQQEQSEINAQQTAFGEAQNYPYKQLQTLISPLQSIQWPTTQTTTQSGGSGGGFGQVLGGLLSLGSMAVPGAGGVSAFGNIFGAKRGGSVPRSPLVPDMERHLENFLDRHLSKDRTMDALASTPAGRRLDDERLPVDLTAGFQDNAGEEYLRGHASGGSIHDHTYDAERAVRGYEEGGSVLDDLLKRIFSNSQNTQAASPLMSGAGNPFTTPGMDLLPDLLRSSFQKRVSELPTEAEIYADDPISNNPPASARSAATEPVSPLLGHPEQMSERPVMTPRPMVRTAQVQSPLDIKWNGPRVQPDQPQAQQPEQALSWEDIKKRAWQDLQDQKNDKWRSALLHMGVAMMGGNGGFGDQLAAGAQAGVADLDSSDKDYRKGMLDIAGLDRKGSNDWLDYMVTKERINKTPSVENKEDSARARAAQDFINNDPSMLSKTPQEKLAIYDQMTGGDKTGVPQANISRTTGNIPQGAIDFLKAHPDQKENFEKKYGVSASQYLQ